MFSVYVRETLGDQILNCLTEITSPKSVSNELGNVFVPNGKNRAPFCPFLYEGRILAQYPAGPSSPGPFVLLLKSFYYVRISSPMVVRQSLQPQHLTNFRCLSLAHP